MMQQLFRRFGLWIMICPFGLISHAQVTGGQHAFEYLRLSNSPHVSALGGLAPANPDRDVSLTLQNPGLLNPKYHNQLALGYNIYYADIGVINLQYAYHVAPLKTDFSLGIQYLNYGKFDHTDLFGNTVGTVRATDYAINLSASRSYLRHWRYGATLKLAQSRLADLSASAILADVGIAYIDTANLWTLGLVAKNMGFIIKPYRKDGAREPLPFDLQLGVTKQLKNMPLRISIVAHHLYEWDVRYDDPAEVKDVTIFGTDPEEDADKSYFVDKLFRHINFSAELILAKRVTISAGYSHLRRSELGFKDQQGLAGFSFGAGIDLNKLHIRYARSYVATAGAYNEIGFSFQLNKFFGLGNKTETWGWNKQY